MGALANWQLLYKHGQPFIPKFEIMHTITVIECNVEGIRERTELCQVFHLIVMATILPSAAGKNLRKWFAAF